MRNPRNPRNPRKAEPGTGSAGWEWFGEMI